MMKIFKATFWRGNPQLKNDGYETTKEFRAKSIEGAIRQAHQYEKCLYGTMSLLTISESES